MDQERDRWPWQEWSRRSITITYGDVTRYVVFVAIVLFLLVGLAAFGECGAISGWLERQDVTSQGPRFDRRITSLERSRAEEKATTSCFRSALREIRKRSVPKLC